MLIYLHIYAAGTMEEEERMTTAAAAPGPRMSAEGSLYSSSSELTTLTAAFSPEIKQAPHPPPQPQPMQPAETKKSVDSFGQRTSIYRGVTR